MGSRMSRRAVNPPDIQNYEGAKWRYAYCFLRIWRFPGTSSRNISCSRRCQYKNNQLLRLQIGGICKNTQPCRAGITANRAAISYSHLRDAAYSARGPNYAAMTGRGLNKTPLKNLQVEYSNYEECPPEVASVEADIADRLGHNAVISRDALPQDYPAEWTRNDTNLTAVSTMTPHSAGLRERKFGPRDHYLSSGRSSCPVTNAHPSRRLGYVKSIAQEGARSGSRKCDLPGYHATDMVMASEKVAERRRNPAGVVNSGDCTCVFLAATNPLSRRPFARRRQFFVDCDRSGPAKVAGFHVKPVCRSLHDIPARCLFSARVQRISSLEGEPISYQTHGLHHVSSLKRAAPTNTISLPRHTRCGVKKKTGSILSAEVITLLRE